jgi:2-methylcitrate dehydratase PrpD
MRHGCYPDAMLSWVRTGFTDCVAVLIAGETEPVTRIVAASVDATERRNASLLGQLRIAAPDAALVYATAAHALDYDDTALSGHPSAVLVPAIIAEAAEIGADGRAMIAAYIAGYEVWAELVRRDRDPHHEKGWHPSAVFGPLAAAAAAAVLRGLDAEQASRALAIAASLASGLVANFGSMTKPFQVGRAAQSGLLAARLAQRGLTASPDALEHSQGFLRAISPNGEVDTESPAWAGREWQMLQSGINIKLYPICYAGHRAVEAMLDIVRAEGLGPDDIAGVRVEIGQTQAAMLRNSRPQTALDAKFSAEFAMAAAAVAGRCGRSELTDVFVQQPAVQAFFPCVQVLPIAERDPEEPAHSPFDRVRVTLRDGRDISAKPVFHPRGHSKRPLEASGLWDKFSDCVSGVLAPSEARRLFANLQSIETAASVSDIVPN